MDIPQGSLYLGKTVDIKTGQQTDEPVLFKADRLVTHGICFGMTGSGKTGLCIDLLEETLLAGVPAILIDPKGDIADLLLAFPDLDAASFQPWVNPDDAARAGLAPAAFASAEAERQKKGLAEWGLDASRVRALREKVDAVVYTPGSDAGVPVDILGALAMPAGLSFDKDAETIAETIAGVSSALLGLVGIEADPLQSKEHILLTNILQHCWGNGESLDLAKTILYVQSPPFRKLGVFEVDALFPAAERMTLAMALNAILASPSFAAWTRGAALDIASILRAPDGRPRAAVFSIAHLSDRERSFFVTLLLEAVLAWVRRQPGSSSLRALLYFDEVFGYMPPHPANPPTKRPLLTLLKQARAFGVGVVLATQNPIDVEYKGLTNTGLWLVGRLQTDRDKLRVLEALEAASAESGGGQLDREALSFLLSSLKPRQFLLHDVRAGKPVLFTSRQALSYLCGPLTREQIRRLADERGFAALAKGGSGGAPGAAAGGAATAAVPKGSSAGPSALLETRPETPPTIPQKFLAPQDANAPAFREALGLPLADWNAGSLAWRAVPAAFVKVRFDEDQDRYVVDQTLWRLNWPTDRPESWLDLGADVPALLDAPPAAGTFHALPAHFRGDADRDKVRKKVIDDVFAKATLAASWNPVLKRFSRPGETPEEYVKAVGEAIEDAKDTEVLKLKGKYEKKIEAINRKLELEKTKLSGSQRDLELRKREKIASVGESILGVFLGSRSRRGFSSYTAKQRMEERSELAVQTGEQKVRQLGDEMAALEQELAAELAAIDAAWAGKEKVESREIRLEKNDILVQDGDLFLLWVPVAG